MAVLVQSVNRQIGTAYYLAPPLSIVSNAQRYPRNTVFVESAQYYILY